MAQDAQARRHHTAGIAGMHPFVQHLHLERSAYQPAQRCGHSQLLVVARTRIQAHDQRDVAHAPAQGADKIGVFLVAALHARKPRLRLAVVRVDMAAGWACPAGVVRRHGNEPTARPRQLVLKLPAELELALIENGFCSGRIWLERFYPACWRYLPLICSCCAPASPRYTPSRGIWPTPANAGHVKTWAKYCINIQIFIHLLRCRLCY